MLNRKSELVSKCRYQNNFLLSNLKRNDNVDWYCVFCVLYCMTIMWVYIFLFFFVSKSIKKGIICLIIAKVGNSEWHTNDILTFHFFYYCILLFTLKVQSCKLNNKKHMIASTQITNTEIFALKFLHIYNICNI